MQVNAERLHEVRRRAVYLFCRCVMFLPVTVRQLVRHGRFRPSGAWRSRPELVFLENVQRVAGKKGAREITLADFHAAIDAGGEVLPGYGYGLAQYSADAGRLLEDAIRSAGGLNATVIDHLRTALASRSATGSNSNTNLTRCSPAT